MDHPPYSSDLAPPWFLAFSIITNAVKGHRFGDNLDIWCNMTLLRVIPENNVQDSFQQRHNCLMKRIASQEEYFEGDSTGEQVLLSQGHSVN
jgi:hypothetical protein